MFQGMKKKFPKVRWFGSDKKEVGQSLVEMAVIVPLLAFIFVGLIEVGWAIRGYLVLLSTNRETTRYAARGDHLNFEGVDLDPATVGDTVNYNRVLTHTKEILYSNELGLNLFDEGPENGAFIISHYLIDTGKPCNLTDEQLQTGKMNPNSNNPNDNNPITCLKNNGGGDCRNPADRKDDYVGDDIMLYPSKAGYEHFIYTQGISSTASRIDPVQLAAELKEENDALNCMIIERGLPNPTLSSNSVIVVEGFYEQPQLLGVPLLSNTLTDPIGLYNQTKMRITTAKFSQGGGCDLLPIAVKEDVFQSAPGVDFPDGTYIPDIRNGGGNGQFGWLRWNGQDSNSPVTGNSPNSAEYLEYATDDPALSINDYKEPPGHGAADKVLNALDWVTGSSGNVAAEGDDLDNYEGKVVTVPVWRQFQGVGSNAEYQIARFIMVQIQEVEMHGSPKFVSAIFLGDDPNCPTGSTDILGY